MSQPRALSGFEKRQNLLERSRQGGRGALLAFSAFGAGIENGAASVDSGLSALGLELVAYRCNLEV